YRAAEEKRRAEEAEQRRIEEAERARAIEEGIIEDEGLTPQEKQQRDEKQAILKMIDEKPADVAMLIKTWLAEDE
ncbi:MAG: flagellar M-ring protein FliF, partial [Selenomonadaceae bacterium]|nr:flagellar M-ring protein FliF [Selenomonadaceae bacterium]